MRTDLFINDAYRPAARDARQSGLGRQGGRYSLEFWTEPCMTFMTYGEESHG